MEERDLFRRLISRAWRLLLAAWDRREAFIALLAIAVYFREARSALFNFLLRRRDNLPERMAPFKTPFKLLMLRF